MVLTSIMISAIVAIILGLLVLFFPKFLRWAVGIWLILTGVLQLLSIYIQFSPVY